jgi:hypothetical protein
MKQTRETQDITFKKLVALEVVKRIKDGIENGDKEICELFIYDKNKDQTL